MEDLNHGQDPSLHTHGSGGGKAIPFALRDLFLHQTSQAIGIMTRVSAPDETASPSLSQLNSLSAPHPAPPATVFDSS